MSRQQKVNFDQDSSRHYEFTHGHKPKGVGAWSFTLHRDGSSTDVWKEGSFSEARRQAMSEARSLGCTVVTVNT